MMGQLKLLNDAVAAAANCEKTRVIEDADDLIADLKQALEV